MSCHASTAGWNAGSEAGSQAGPTQRRCGPPKGLEIAGIVLGFVFFWPLALAYLIWKCAGYPVPNEAKSFFEKNFSRLGWGPNGGGPFRARPFSSTGNFAFEEYRRRELERLEEERRRLDEEAHAFAEFVEELKRAKDRDEFDAFLAKRRQGPAAA
ncbi:MAG TPA: DUF2852 domain-containing protein [Beijerinckiaceae bacterium]|jgi:hypothetical protein